MTSHTTTNLTHSTSDLLETLNTEALEATDVINDNWGQVRVAFRAQEASWHDVVSCSSVTTASTSLWPGARATSETCTRLPAPTPEPRNLSRTIT